MSDRDEDCINRLDYEFSQMLQEIVLRLREMNFREKLIATEWIAKLKHSKRTLEEITLRNAFITYFVLNRCVFRTEPFNEPPPSGPLTHLADFLPCREKVQCLGASVEKDEKYLISEVMEELPDEGKFLSVQPVPRDGVFVIMLIRRKPN